MPYVYGNRDAIFPFYSILTGNATRISIPQQNPERIWIDNESHRILDYLLNII